MLKHKSVYARTERHRDGLRIHTARTRGRGLPSSKYAVWMSSLGPSQKLLSEYRAEKITWGEFSRQYKRELLLDGPIDRRSRTIKNHGQKFTFRLIKELARQGNVTLMCTCEPNQEYCHRRVLHKFIQSKRV